MSELSECCNTEIVKCPAEDCDKSYCLKCYSHEAYPTPPTSMVNIDTEKMNDSPTTTGSHPLTPQPQSVEDIDDTRKDVQSVEEILRRFGTKAVDNSDKGRAEYWRLEDEVEATQAITHLIQQAEERAELLGRAKEAVNLRHRWVMPDVLMGKFDDRIRELQAQLTTSKEAQDD